MEKDPTGLDSHAPGAKLDSGKVMCALVLGGFAPALMQVSEVGTLGAIKYSENGWLCVENGIRRYQDAMMRHLLKQLGGEDKDPDSGQLHAAHVAWNALAVLTLMSRGGKKEEEPRFVWNPKTLSIPAGIPAGDPRFVWDTSVKNWVAVPDPTLGS